MNMKDFLRPLRVLHGRFHDWWDKKKNALSYLRQLLFPLGKKVFVLGTPSHTNIGDSAIALAEMRFLECHTKNAGRIKELTVQEVKQNREGLFRIIRGCRSNIVCFHGGGNLGNQWLDEELFRRNALNELPHNKSIIFPQTLFYTPTEKGKNEELASIAYYNGHAGLTMIAREQKSFDEMRRLYPDTDILLAPDIVLSSTKEDFGVTIQERHGVLICARSDAEKSVNDSVWDSLKAEIANMGIEYRVTDMYSDHRVTKENRAETVREKMMEFGASELVITDRLHGMVFAALSETPCIVFSNYNHKVRGTYEWIRYLPYIRYVESEDEAKHLIPELLSMKDCSFDNKPLQPYFDRIAEVINEKCH